MIKSISKFIIFVELATFIIITIVHFFKILFMGFNSAFASYISALGKEHLGSIKGIVDITTQWIDCLSTKQMPLKETVLYFGKYKITWVGLLVLVYMVRKSYIENRQGY